MPRISGELPGRRSGRDPAHHLFDQPRRLCHAPAKGANTFETLQGKFRRDLLMQGCERRIACGRDGQLESESFWILELETIAVAGRRHAVRRQALRPELQRGHRSNPQRDPVDHPRASPAAGGARILEKGQVEPGRPGLVAVEEVVDVGIVLVDCLGHQAQPEDPGIEGEVTGGVAGDAGYVMDAVEAHGGK